jgi:hypothetical protein
MRLKARAAAMAVRTTWSASRRMLAVAAATVVVTAIAAPAAVASSNNAPSRSTPVGVGVPFSGSWPGTVHAYGNPFNHWWRLPATLRPGDSVQLAVDNRLVDYTVYFCLVPPIDDFDADDALERCRTDASVTYNRQDRIQMTYGESTGQAHLVAFIRYGCCWTVGEEAPPDVGQYTVVIERIVTRVTPGLVVPGSIPAAFSVSAPLRYGDNAPAADGTGAVLQWRYRAARGRKPSGFANLATASSAGGAATFAASLPGTARGRRVQLRACASQPGGDTLVCTAAQNTTVQAGPAPACVGAKTLRAKRSRAVTRLKLRVRQAQGRRAKRAARRKLRAAQRRLAASRRAVRINC